MFAEVSEPTGGAASQPVGTETDDLAALAEGEGTGTPPSGATQTSEAPAFYDASKVPPELQPTFREMQKGLTQKFQEVATERKSLAEVARDADNWKRLVADPRFQDWARSQQAGTSNAEGENSEEIPGDPETIQTIRKFVDPVRTELRQLREQTALAREREQFVKDHPDWEAHKEAMAEAIRQVPTRTLEDAFNWAYRQSTEKRLAEIRSNRAASRAGTETKSTPGTLKTAPGKIDSFDDALEYALKEQGMTRRDL
jgi:hypothetical protein